MIVPTGKECRAFDEIVEESDLFVEDAIAIDVESRVENPTTDSTSIVVLYTDDLFDKLFDDLNNHVLDEAIHNDAVKKADVLVNDICDVHKDVDYDFDFEELDSGGEGYKRDDVPNFMPRRVRKTRNELKETKWERYTRLLDPYVEESTKSIFAYHVRELDQEKCYGI